ncbi:MAG TPA: SBBP repeat-containing protein [Bryobacteraceae bacterium]|nr:SBBP repeat-containing protein [Bryobacteraceae bacterium]
MQRKAAILRPPCLMAALAVAFSTQLSGTQTIAHYVDIGDQGESRLLAADGAGNVFVVSNVIEPWGQPQIRVTKMDPNGKVLAVLDFGGSNLQIPDAVAGARTDAQGNLVIVGTTGSADFPSVGPLSSTTAQYTAFVVKLDSQLSRLQFSIRLGGTQTGFLNGLAKTSAGGLALDGSGNIFVAGTTDATDFPVTKNAFQAGPPQASTSGTPFYAFVSEISADGTQLVSSTYFGASGGSCAVFAGGGTICHPVTTGVSAIALDSAGNVVIAGPTNAPLPVTPGAYMAQCAACNSFLAKLSPDSSKLLWATFLGASASAPSGLSISTMALAADGSVIVGGTSPRGLSVTPGALQASIPGQATSGGFVAKLDAQGQHLTFATYLGGDTPVTDAPVVNVMSLAVDAQGTIWVTGGSDPSLFPLPAGTPSLGPLYTVGLSADGSHLTSAMTAPLGGAGVAIALTARGAVLTLGQSGSVLRAAPGQGPSLMGVANSGAYHVCGSVAPLELISLYGAGLGPAAPMTAQVVNNGSINLVSTSLGGVQVLFDGIAAPLLYAGSTQINAIVPWEVYGHESTTVQIVSPGGNLTGLTFQVKLSQPQVFRYPGTQFALALNEDGTPNSASNPAAAGSVVSIWATGAGITFPGAQPDGQIIPSPLGPLLTPQLPVSVLAPAPYGSGRAQDGLEVLYGGDANGMVQGVMQVNFRLPASNAAVLQLRGARLQVGGSASEPFQIYVK